MTADSLSADRQSVDSVSSKNDADETAVRDSLAARDDFITVSLLISEPLPVLFSVFGHATLRMECPTYHLDYIYTLESDDTKGVFITGVLGKAKAKYVAIVTDSILSDCRNQGRQVMHYRINLTPREKQELWRLLDEEIAAGAYHNFNLLTTNCLSSSIINVQRCLIGEHFEWGPLRHPMTLCDGDMFRYTMRNAPWAEFFLVTFGGTAYDRFTTTEYRLTPEAVIPMLREARFINDETGENRFVVTDPGTELVPAGEKGGSFPLSPLVTFGILLVLALVVTAIEWLTGKHGIGRVFDIILFTAQGLMGLLLLIITFFSEIFVSTWNWYLIVFLPLPLLIWCCLEGKKAARCWLVYSIILVLFIAATPLIKALDLPHQLITASLLVRSLSRYRELNHST